jgi:hypothetical protein
LRLTLFHFGSTRQVGRESPIEVISQHARVDLLARALIGQRDQSLQHRSGRGDERFQHATAFGRHGRYAQLWPHAKPARDLFGRRRVGQVLLVELEQHGRALRVQTLGSHVHLQVLQAPAVLLLPAVARIRDEDDGVGPAQHDLSRRVVANLSGHRVELDADLVAEDVTQIEGQQIEEQRAIVRGL